MIVIVNYGGIGNTGSLLNMFKKIGQPAIISARADDIAAAEKLVLPGVGAFDNGIESLRRSDFFDVISKRVLQDKIPILGICLGMQLFALQSEEGKQKGLGWLDAKVIRFSFPGTSNLKVPHMGWNTISVQKESKLFQGLDNDAHFYFVHSYHMACSSNGDILATTNHGYDFVSAVEKENIIGVQFHPEKSHRFGMQILKNFAQSN